MFTVRKRHGRWHWVCTWCHPRVSGSTVNFRRLLVSLHHHFAVRRCHHRHVAATRGQT